MYIRFTTQAVDEESHSLLGVFQSAFALRDSSELAEHEEVELNDALEWLEMHLKSPTCLREPENRRAICWFDPRAQKPMRFIWRVIQVLQEHGVFVEVHKTDDPGNVLYQDGWQFVAKPWRKGRRSN
ncbi:MAG: hypothetical protein AAF589_00195 [Planctomycetota bacterium]